MELAPALVHVLLVWFFFVEEFILGTTSGRQRLGDRFLITSVALTFLQNETSATPIEFTIDMTKAKQSLQLYAKV